MARFRGWLILSSFILSHAAGRGSMRSIMPPSLQFDGYVARRSGCARGARSGGSVVEVLRVRECCR